MRRDCTGPEQSAEGGGGAHFCWSKVGEGRAQGTARVNSNNSTGFRGVAAAAPGQTGGVGKGGWSQTVQGTIRQEGGQMSRT